MIDAFSTSHDSVALHHLLSHMELSPYTDNHRGTVSADAIWMRRMRVGWIFPNINFMARLSPFRHTRSSGT